MARLVMTVSYDGSGFAGSQVQPRARTVQGELERALVILRYPDQRTLFAGRTDTGVHAAGQVVACEDARPAMSGPALRAALNALLPDDLVVKRVDRRGGEFHPRYDARWREYRYRIWSGERAPLGRSAIWHRRSALDVHRMDAAAKRFIGTKDFASVAGGGEGVPWAAVTERGRGTIRTVLACGCKHITPWWGPDDGDGALYEVRVVADGFLPRMVRSMAAVIVDVGRNARSVDAVDKMLSGRDRRLGGGTAPAQGLTLWRVGYTDWAPASIPPA